MQEIRILKSMCDKRKSQRMSVKGLLVKFWISHDLLPFLIGIIVIDVI